MDALRVLLYEPDELVGIAATFRSALAAEDEHLNRSSYLSHGRAS
ncbi:MAG TPA: hypothetical protein VJP45_05800 [Candidatus Limnocylindria bacterium]|nr:hypothetical protein [Candidatus Limnocylindria bacterium]